MFKKITLAVVLVAIGLSLVSGAEAGSKIPGGEAKSVSGLGLGSGR